MGHSTVAVLDLQVGGGSAPSARRSADRAHGIAIGDPHLRPTPALFSKILYCCTHFFKYQIKKLLDGKITRLGGGCVTWTACARIQSGEPVQCRGSGRRVVIEPAVDHVCS